MVDTYGLFRPEADDVWEYEADTARAMAVTEAGSFSGGELAQRCNGFMLSNSLGVPGR